MLNDPFYPICRKFFLVCLYYYEKKDSWHHAANKVHPALSAVLEVGVWRALRAQGQDVFVVLPAFPCHPPGF